MHHHHHHHHHNNNDDDDNNKKNSNRLSNSIQKVRLSVNKKKNTCHSVYFEDVCDTNCSAVPKYLKKRLKEIREKIKTMQIITLSRLPRILWRVVETWADAVAQTSKIIMIIIIEQKFCCHIHPNNSYLAEHFYWVLSLILSTPYVALCQTNPGFIYVQGVLKSGAIKHTHICHIFILQFNMIS